MRVLMLAPALPPESYGGAGRSTLELAAGLAGRGVYSYLLSPGKGHDTFLVHREFDAETVPIGAPPFNAKGIVGRRRAYRRRVLDLLAAGRFDVVHDSGGYLYGDVLKDLRRDFDGPVLVQFRTSLPTLVAAQDERAAMGEFSTPTIKAWAVSQERRTVTAADHIVCLADHVASRLQAVYGVVPVIIRTGIHPRAKERRASSGAARILLAGRLDDRAKGAEFGLSVLRYVTRAMGGVEAVVTAAAQNQLPADGIEYIGVQTFEAFDEVIQRADIVLVPSLYDCSPRVVLEAMSYGRLVIAREGPGTREIISNGIDGLLYDGSASSEAVAELICITLGDREEIRRMGESARETISKRYGFESMLTETIAAYHAAELAAEQRRAF